MTPDRSKHLLEFVDPKIDPKISDGINKIV